MLIRVLCACMALICYNTIETMYTIVITMQCKYSTTNARGIVSYKVVGSLQENKKYINFIEIYSHSTSSYRKTQVKISGLLCKNNVSFTVLGHWWEKASTFDLRLTASTLPSEQHKVTGTQSYYQVEAHYFTS